MLRNLLSKAQSFASPDEGDSTRPSVSLSANRGATRGRTANGRTATDERATPRWAEKEITNEEHLQIVWTAASLVNIDREMGKYAEKDPRNFALIQATTTSAVLIVTRAMLENELSLNILQNVVDRRQTARVEKFLVSKPVFTTVMERLSKKGTDAAAATKAIDSETLREFKEIVKGAVLKDASDIHVRGDQKRPRIDLRVLGEITRTENEYSYERLKKLCLAAFGTQSEKGSNKGSVLTFEAQQRAAFPVELEINTRTQLFKLRFELTPCQSGFHAAMRILWMSGEKARKGASLEQDLLDRGYLPDQARNLALVGYKNGGSIILSGQTGSGKTQTLYCIMRHIATVEKIAIAIEDPVEGDLEGVTQIQVATKENQSTDAAITDIIKSILRLDPDIALVSELRGKESAGGFQQLLQSGHKSLTTVHADSPIGIYERLASDQFQLDRGFLSTPDNLSICVFQNLVQTLCPHCAMTHSQAGISASYMRTMEKSTGTSDLSLVRFRNPAGCPECQKISPLPGVSGRTVAASMLIPDDDILLLLREKKTLEAFREFRSRRTHLYEADTTGKSAMETATYKALNGIVDPREVEATFEAYELYAAKNRKVN